MKKLNKKGFTLVELLAVIVVLALLMVVAASSIGSALDNSKKKSLVSEAKKLYTNITSEAKSLAMTNSLTSSNIQNVYKGKDGDFKYDVTINKDGDITALKVCYDKYSITASGTPLSVPNDVDEPVKTCSTDGSVTLSTSTSGE